MSSKKPFFSIFKWLVPSLFIVLIVTVTWLSRPFIDRTARGSNPIPLQAAEYGPTDTPSNLHSGRKSVISLLFGIAQAKGLVDMNATLAELGIDEKQTPLTDTEKSATIADLLQARSGVYLTSGAETQNMKDGRPARGQYKPGEHYYYNNWDFNVLGTIFEQEAGLSIGDAIETWLAQPLGMEDFHPSHVIYDLDESATQHRTYRIHMSARSGQNRISSAAKSGLGRQADRAPRVDIPHHAAHLRD